MTFSPHTRLTSKKLKSDKASCYGFDTISYLFQIFTMKMLRSKMYWILTKETDVAHTVVDTSVT